jgi:hypothetical protein
LGKSSNFFGAIGLNAKAPLILGRLYARGNVNSVPGFWRTAMEYKGIRFEIVETTNPYGWKWIVFLDETRMRTGQALTRADAALDAELAIEKALEDRQHA